MYSIEEYDREKTKVLKYVIYKKRTIREIKTKFKPTIEEDMLEDIIEELKENGYISDKNYIKRAVNEYMALRNLSIKEMKYKLAAKGIIKVDIIEDYISKNSEKLEEYEQKSADNIVLRKSSSLDEAQIKGYLLKKGYSEESIRNAMEKMEK